MYNTTDTAKHRALSVIVHQDKLSETMLAEESAEMSELAAAANLAVLATAPFRVRNAHPATYIGKGMVEKIRLLAETCQVRQLLFNCELTITQTRGLERILALPVIDRTELILSIFSRRATSHEGKLQVELARCRRQMGQLSGLWTHLERQRGGIGVRGGPGEKQMELDRRLLAKRVQRLEAQIEKIINRGDNARIRRRKNGVLTATLVGYTNAGKSSLFNLLANENRPANNRLFDTLDTTARRIRLSDDNSIILSDTVGFIRQLPHELVAGFRATLRDTADSDILLIVSDTSAPDWKRRLRLVNRQLDDIGTAQTSRIIVFNKIDKSGLQAKASLSECGKIPSVFVSCSTKAGIPLLRQLLIGLTRDMQQKPPEHLFYSSLQQPNATLLQ